LGQHEQKAAAVSVFDSLFVAEGIFCREYDDE
jgi:hypothetical protein